MIKRVIAAYELSLEEGDICQFYSGAETEHMIVIGNQLLGVDGWDELDYYDKDLCNKECSSRDIQAVYRLDECANLYKLDDIKSILSCKNMSDNSNVCLVWSRGE